MCVNFNQSTLHHIHEDHVIELIIAGTSNFTEILYEYFEQSGILQQIACHISKRFL